jgi:hypothetical protein
VKTILSQINMKKDISIVMRYSQKYEMAKRMKHDKGSVVLFMAPKSFTRLGHVMS